MDRTQQVFKNKYAQINYFPDQQVVILILLLPYVPIEHFKEALNWIEEYATAHKISRMVLDKSNLRIFHQPSMEWYHIVWKEKMYSRGLKSYRKILPDDNLFAEGVKIGREKIIRENPGFNIGKFDIRYCKDLNEALEF